MTSVVEMPVAAANSPTRLERVRRTLARRPGIAVFAVYALLSLLADLPIWPGDPNQVPTQLGGDIVQTAWFLEWTPWAILHGHNPFFSTVINWPHGVNIAQNTGIQLLAVLSSPLTLLVSPIASENLLRFLAFPLSGYAAYWVLRRFTTYLPGAFCGGLLYGFSPYMVTQGEFHLNLIFVPFPPLILYALFEVCVAQQRQARRWGLLLGLFATLQFYVSAEVLATTALIGAIGLFYLFFLGISHVRAKLPHAIEGLAIGAGVTLVLCGVPIYEMLHGLARYTGPAQGYDNVYNADLLGPVLPTSLALVTPARLSEIGTNLVGAQVQENGSYLGIPLIVTSCYFVGRYWRRLWPLFVALMAGSAFVLSLGPKLVVDGRRIALPVDLPFAKIAHLPIVENILPVRLSLYVVFFVALILAMGLDELHRDVVARHADAEEGRHVLRAFTPGHVLAALAAALSLVALLPRWPYRHVAVKLGVHYSESAKGLRIIPKGASVLAYPYPTSFFDMAMLWQSLDDMRFNLLGSYALVPNAKGTATLFPAILEPERVEAMLVNSVTMVADPDLPVLVATSRSVNAQLAVVLAPGSGTPKGHPVLVGRLGSINYAEHTFYLYPNHFTPVAVHYRASTRFVSGDAPYFDPSQMRLNERVAIYGTTGPGTVDAAMVRGLRRFVIDNHVEAVVVGLGITDAAEVSNWFKAALGRPTRAGGGAEVWTGLNRLRS